MNTPTPWRGRAAAVSLLSLTWLLATGQTPDDADAFYEIAEAAVTPSQLEEMSAGLVPVGVLADGTGRESVELPSGPTVPAAMGIQPLEHKPLPPLPMPDNPGLLDEIASGGVPTATQQLRAYKAVQTNGVFEWTIDQHWDLSKALPEGMSASDVIPDFNGDYWFISGFAHVGHLDAETGEAKTIWLYNDGYELIGAAFTVGPEGAYVLTSKAMYMFVLDAEGTPTLHDQDRLVCRMNMFKDGTAAIQNTVMAYGRSIGAAGSDLSPQNANA